MADVVKQRPADFASLADDFLTLDPTYVRFLLSGLTQAVKGGATLNWGPVLRTCRRIVEGPPALPEPRIRDSDPDWGWTHRQIADLLSAGFEGSASGLELTDREEAWSALVVLTRDADPTPAQEATYGGDNMDPATYSINTTRGTAMHSVVRYAGWIHARKDQKAEASLPAEARTVLDDHLDLAQEPSPAIRAVYGMRFKQLVALDPKWAHENASQIFAVDPALTESFLAAWNAYVVFNDPWGDALDFAGDACAAAVEQLADPPEGRYLGGNPRQRLGEHLLMLFWWGRLDATHDSLIGRFWSAASDSLRGRLVQFVGRAVGAESAEPLPADVQARLRDLWTWIFEQEIDPATSDARAEVLAPFGWWYTAGAFEDEWALDQLFQVAEQGVTPDPFNQIIERVPNADASLTTRLAVVKALAQTDMRPYLRDTAVQGLTELFAAAHDADDAATRALATDAIDALIARGLMQFRNITA